MIGLTLGVCGFVESVGLRVWRVCETMTLFRGLWVQKAVQGDDGTHFVGLW